MIEPINPRDIPGYFLNHQDEAPRDLRAKCGASNLKVQIDIYHCQIVEGDLATSMKRDLHGIGHMQIAGVPERHEPDRGEVNYPYLFRLMDELGYDGWVGCEYRPKAGTSEGLNLDQFLVTQQCLRPVPPLAFIGKTRHRSKYTENLLSKG